MDFSISDLRDRPEFFDTIAERMWRAWWQPSGHPKSRVVDGLSACVNATPIPFALVAHDGAAFLGSTLGIASDLADRPDYTPWVAAVWVEPQHRLRKLGRTIVAHAVRQCFDVGFRRVYLCSSVERRNFYVRQGWLPIEENVGKAQQTVYVQDKR